MVIGTLRTRLGAIGAAAVLAGLVPLIAPATSLAAQASPANVAAAAQPPGTYEGSDLLDNDQDHDCLWAGVVTVKKSKVAEIRIRGCNSKNADEEWGFYKQARYVNTAYMLQSDAYANCLAANAVTIRGCNGDALQQAWGYEGQSFDTGLYVNLYYGKCLQGNSTGTVTLAACNSKDKWQLWQLPLS
jgi:hypothetical protein